jgi:hypothetical protein
MTSHSRALDNLVLNKVTKKNIDKKPIKCSTKKSK